MCSGMQLCSGCGICVPSLWGGCCCHCPLDVAISCACRTLQGALREGSVQRGRVQASLHSVHAEMCAGISQSSSQLLITLQMIVWDTELHLKTWELPAGCVWARKEGWRCEKAALCVWQLQAPLLQEAQSLQGAKQCLHHPKSAFTAPVPCVWGA